MARTLSVDLRPASFDEIIGSEEAVATIQNKLASGVVPNAITLTGPLGTGKTTLALIIARELQGFDFPVDMEPEIIHLNAAKVRGIDAFKELTSQAEYSPLIGRRRVIILDEAQQLTKDAQNCLLPELEKANSPTTWILCTTNPEKILDTLRSRGFTVALSGMGAQEREALVIRAASHLGYTGPIDGFLKHITARHVVSPRLILMAFETFCAGTSAEEAVANVTQEFAPEYHEIAFAVTFGKWGRAVGNKRAVRELLLELDEKLKKAAKEKEKEKAKEKQETEGAEPENGETEIEDMASRPEVAAGLRAVIASFLKGRVLKGNPQEQDRAAEGIYIITHCISGAQDKALEYPATIGGIYRVCRRLDSQKTS
jgi:hypothetical protein